MFETLVAKWARAWYFTVAENMRLFELVEQKTKKELVTADDALKLPELGWCTIIFSVLAAHPQLFVEVHCLMLELCHLSGEKKDEGAIGVGARHKFSGAQVGHFDATPGTLAVTSWHLSIQHFDKTMKLRRN